MALLLTVPIPNTPLAIGLSTFGPAAIPAGVTWARVTIDRTEALGLNSLLATDTFKVNIETSLDGGTTWDEEVEAGLQGGGASATSWIQVAPINGDPSSTTRRIRASIHADAAVVVAGTLTAGS